ncbi:MAG TPA: hypothetical protein PKE40_10190 [Arachnia sp.]|nr:hypothetical protein [Arachnia sp.]HMT86711.1 hypothetical protein [Arachnia sp.]
MALSFLTFLIMAMVFVVVTGMTVRALTGRGGQKHLQPPRQPPHLPGPRMPHRIMTPMLVPPNGGRPVHPLTPAARQACDDDITAFGTELRDLDLDVVGRPLDDAAHQDYTRALDAYDAAKLHLTRAQYDIDVRRVAEILEEGRYAMACVRARVNGRPVPTKRPPCFFDPAHGPSTRDVTWAPPGGIARQVPACEADAQRVQVGADPRVRMVNAGGALVPYWENRDYAPWVQGYYRRYKDDPNVGRLVTGAVMVGGFSILMGLLDDLG